MLFPTCYSCLFFFLFFFFLIVYLSQDVSFLPVFANPSICSLTASRQLQSQKKAITLQASEHKHYRGQEEIGKVHYKGARLILKYCLPTAEAGTRADGLMFEWKGINIPPSLNSIKKFIKSTVVTRHCNVPMSGSGQSLTSLPVIFMLGSWQVCRTRVFLKKKKLLS